MKFDDKRFLAEQIRFYRKQKGYTQEELAEKVDLSAQHISRIESGCYIPSLCSFFKLISVLDIDLKKFGYNLQKTNNPKKDKLINFIADLSDEELTLYENVIEAIDKSL